MPSGAGAIEHLPPDLTGQRHRISRESDEEVPVGFVANTCRPLKEEARWGGGGVQSTCVYQLPPWSRIGKGGSSFSLTISLRLE